MAEWRFPSNDYGENKGINDSGVAMFRGTPLQSLAREICQNSLDASTEEKTIVQFNLFEIKSTSIPGRDTLEDTFERCLSFWGSQKAKATKEFFTTALNNIREEKCTFLRISDFNTTGLTGSRGEINTDWTNLTKSSGSSDKKGTAGGSYGIGKFAPFACSSFSTVFYSTYDIHEEHASQGVARLVTFQRNDGQNTQGTGYYGEERNTPINQEMNLDPDFCREQGQYGTDIYIAGYKYAGNGWEKDIIVSLLDGFLGAIWKGKLEAVVGNIIIGKDNLNDIIEEYKDDLTGYTDYYYNVLESGETVWNCDDFLGMGDIRLGLLLTSNDSPKRIAMIRQTGMKIMDKDRLPGHVPFMGVMFIEGNAINEQLRVIENPEHTKWEPNRSSKPIIARQLLKALNDYIKERIEDFINSGSGESIDAAGVGSYIPDIDEDADEKASEETVSNKVVDVELKEAKKQSFTQKNSGNYEAESDGTDGGHMEQGGSDEEWFHTGGTTKNPGSRPGQEAHPEPDGKQKRSERISVGAEKLVCLCIDKTKGKYMLKVVPDRDGEQGVIELFLSAETKRYPAPLKKISLIGGDASMSGNRILGLHFKKGKDLRLSVEIEYSDYCSMEVNLYATSK